MVCLWLYFCHSLPRIAFQGKSWAVRSGIELSGRQYQSTDSEVLFWVLVHLGRLSCGANLTRFISDAGSPAEIVFRR
jgi:hypothetical protein